MFLGACTVKPNLCLVLEYCVHGSLHHFLKSEATHGVGVTMSLVLRFALDIARGVYYLHRKQSIVQRDLKARNILIDSSLNAKVADFGLSRVLDDDENKLTACGTPAWTAPEVVRLEAYTDKVDVYSFGIILWELLTRDEPYGGQKGVQIAYAAAEQGLRPEIPSYCPDEYRALMESCWADNPDDRPAFGVVLKQLFQMKRDADAEVLTSLGGGDSDAASASGAGRAAGHAKESKAAVSSELAARSAPHSSNHSSSEGGSHGGKGPPHVPRAKQPRVRSVDPASAQDALNRGIVSRPIADGGWDGAVESESDADTALHPNRGRTGSQSTSAGNAVAIAIDDSDSASAGRRRSVPNDGPTGLNVSSPTRVAPAM